jgi:hypothetical protein
VYPEVEQPVAIEVEAPGGSGAWPGRDCESGSESGCLQPGYGGGSRAGSAASEPEKGSSKVGAG